MYLADCGAPGRPVTHPISSVVVSSLWVAELVISSRTAEKLRRKHQVEPEDVRDALVCVRGLRFVIEHDPSYHVIVEFWLGRDRMLASLYPTVGMAEDAWNLASAYRVGR